MKNAKELWYSYSTDMQTLCEHTMGYIAATKRFMDKEIENFTPRALLLPISTNIHAKMLQAIAYKAIQKAYCKEKNITFVIVTQNPTSSEETKSKQVELIFPQAKKTMPICGYKIPCKNITDYLSDTYFQEKNQKRNMNFDDNAYKKHTGFFSQLPFLRILMPKCNILPMQLATTTPEKVTHLLLHIYAAHPKSIFLFLSDINVNIEEESSKEKIDVEKILSSLEKGSIAECISKNNKILHIFLAFAQMAKKQPRIVMYADTRESSLQQNFFTLYTVMGF